MSDLIITNEARQLVITRLAGINSAVSVFSPLHGRPAKTSIEDVLHLAERLEALAWRGLLPEAAQSAAPEAALPQAPPPDAPQIARLPLQPRREVSAPDALSLWRGGHSGPRDGAMRWGGLMDITRLIGWIWVIRGRDHGRLAAGLGSRVFWATNPTLDAAAHEASCAGRPSPVDATSRAMPGMNGVRGLPPCDALRKSR